MKSFLVSLLFLVLLGIRVPASFAQPDQSYQKLAQEIEVLKSQLQTVENVEKMKLLAELADAQAKLADANAKLIDTEFGKFERKLRDSNTSWMRNMSVLLLAFISAIGITILTVIWNHFKSTIDSLIENEVGERVNRFEEAVNEVDVLKNQIKESIGQVDLLRNKIRVLDKEHAAEVIERLCTHPLINEDSYPEQMKELQEDALLDVFRDETRHPNITERTAEVLARRQSDRLVSLLLERLNSTLDSHQDKELESYTASHLRYLVDILGIYPHAGNL